jgi:CelD/BcsL family acetyltransferase involved in cellulose biosynthesis
MACARCLSDFRRQQGAGRAGTADRGVDALEFWNDSVEPGGAEMSAHARYLRTHVLELPIHQDLTPDHVEYVARQVTQLESAGGCVMLDLIESVEGFAALGPDWNSLLRASEADSPFLTHEWLLAWWKHLGRSRTLQLLAVRDHDELIGLAPLCLVSGPGGMFPRLEFLGTGHAGSDYLDLIVRRGRERESLDTLAAAMKARKRALRLTHLPATSVASRLADSLAEDGWTLRIAEGGVCPVVRLAGHSWDSYLGSLGASHRANFKRRCKALGQRFDLHFEAVTSETARHEASAR